MVIEGDKPAIIDIILIQGNNKAIGLAFTEKNAQNVTVPMDLTTFSSIKMDIKERASVKESPFISWTVGSGLTVSGDDDNVLIMQFRQEFFETQTPEWVYDIKFVKNSNVSHYIMGTIRVLPVTTM